MKSKTDTAPSTGANPSTLTTAGQPAPLSPEQIDQAAQDVAGMISAAKMLLTVGGSEAVNGSIYILEYADERMERDVLPATMRATAPEAESAPKLTAVDAPAGNGLEEARNAAEGPVIDLNRLYATVSAMASSDGDESELRECMYSILELLRPIQADAQRAHDLVAALRRPSVAGQK